MNWDKVIKWSPRISLITGLVPPAVFVVFFSVGNNDPLMIPILLVAFAAMLSGIISIVMNCASLWYLRNQLTTKKVLRVILLSSLWIVFILTQILFSGTGQRFIDSFSLPIPDLSSSDILPTEIGQCSETTISVIGNRLEGVSDSGRAIEYANGGYQVSYGIIRGSEDSAVGDKVKLCLKFVPENCPAGDDRGRVYSSLNLRNGKYWEGMDSQHFCGGA